MNLDFKNIKHGPLTTIAAVLIIVLTTVFVWFGKESFTSIWPSWLFVFFLLFTEDPKPKGPKTLLFLLPLFFFLSSCGTFSPQNKLNRLLSKHPELKITQTDTIYYDTNFIRVIPREKFAIPLNLNEPNVIKGLYYNLQISKDTIKDTLFVNVIAKPDTVYIQKFIPYQKQIINTQVKCHFVEVIKYLIALFILILVIFIFIKLFY